MNWKRGGLMNNRYIYFGEGPCEVQILNALKENPSKIQPGKVVHLNVVQDLLPKSMILGFRQGTTIVFVFDTDVNETKHLKKNIELIIKIIAIICDGENPNKPAPLSSNLKYSKVKRIMP